MVKSVQSVAARGFRDWAWQRVTSIIIALYSIWLITYLLSHSDLSFAEWHFLFSQMHIKIANILFLGALLIHAWIGIWTVITDYVKSKFLSGILQLFIKLMLIAFFIWGIFVVGSV